jgi:polar amino acid transport system substrate-binding protein
MRRLPALLLLAALTLACAQLGTGGGPGPEPAPERGLAAILARGELRVGLTGEQPPLNMTTKKNELVGLEVALTRVLAGLIGVRPVFVRMPFHQLLDAVETGRVDMAMSGVAITPERNLRVAFVGPYFVSGKSLLSKSKRILSVQTPGELDRSDLRIAALAGSTSADYARRHLPNAKLTLTDGLPEAVALVQEDRVDALLADLETCHFAALRHGGGLRSLGRAFTVEPMGIAVGHGDIRLINLLENYLKTLDIQGALAKARDYWFEDDQWLDALR